MTIFAVMLRRHVPVAAHGPPVAVFLSDALSQPDVVVAAVPQPSGVGRFRGVHLLTVSLLFWFVGLIPDLATLRDRAKNRAAQDRLWRALDGLAGFGGSLVAL